MRRLGVPRRVIDEAYGADGRPADRGRRPAEDGGGIGGREVVQIARTALDGGPQSALGKGGIGDGKTVPTAYSALARGVDRSSPEKTRGGGWMAVLTARLGLDSGPQFAPGTRGAAIEMLY